MLTTISNVIEPILAISRGQSRLSLKSERLLVGATLFLFLLLGVWYSLAVPPFETPDEIYHYAFARHLAQGNALPVQSANRKGPWEQEGSQAPLYYMLVGWLTAGIDQRDLADIATLNPRANIGDPLFPGNKNRMLYSAKPRPLQGVNLALHIGRWFSLCLGVLTLWLTYLTAKLAFPHSRYIPLITLLFVASIPQFIFISASLSNDNMIIATSAAVVYWLARLLAKQADPARPRTEHGNEVLTRSMGTSKSAPSEWLVLGFLLSLAALSKLQGLGLFALSAFAVLMLAWTRREWSLPLRVLLPIALPALVLAGWWYWRNYTLYGDWSGMKSLLDRNGQRNDPLTLMSLWQEFRGLRYSFWGLFGWFNILLPIWVYTVMDMVTVVALAGLVWRMVRRRYSVSISGQNLSMLQLPYIRVRLMILLWATLSLAQIFYWISRATGSQGRLLFPAIGAFAILLLIGLDVWLHYLPLRWRLGTLLALPGLLIGCSLFALLVRLPVSYAAPKPVTRLPATVKTVDVVYGDHEKLTLLGLETPTTRFKPGDRVSVTLYMQADKKLHDDYQVFIQFLDEKGVEVGNLTTHPGWGRNPTRLWQPGAIYADAYPVLIQHEIDERSPLLANVYIGFIDPRTEKSGHLPIPAHTHTGEKIDPPFLAKIAITPLHLPQLNQSGAENAGVQFGHVIQLSRYAQPHEITLLLNHTFTVTLQWDTIGTPATDYTAFVHFRNADGKTVANADREPAAGRFPTSFWRAGDRVLSEYVMSLPAQLKPGSYEVWVGLYETNSKGALRLPVTEKVGRTTGDGEVLLGKVTIR